MDALYSWPGGRALANAPVNSTDADSKVPSTTASVLLPVDSVASRAKHDATQLFSKDRGSVLPVGSALELQKRLVQLAEAAQSAQTRLQELDSCKATTLQRGSAAQERIATAVTRQLQDTIAPLDQQRRTLVGLLQQSELLASRYASLAQQKDIADTSGRKQEYSWQDLQQRHQSLVQRISECVSQPTLETPSVDTLLTTVAQHTAGLVCQAAESTGHSHTRQGHSKALGTTRHSLGPVTGNNTSQEGSSFVQDQIRQLHSALKELLHTQPHTSPSLPATTYPHTQHTQHTQDQQHPSGHHTRSRSRSQPSQQPWSHVSSQSLTHSLCDETYDPAPLTLSDPLSWMRETLGLANTGGATMHTHMNSHTLASSDRVPHTQGTGLGVGAGVSGALGAGLGGAFGPVMGVHSGVSNSVKVSSTAGVVSGDVSSTNTLKSEYRLMVHQLRDRYEAERYKLGMQHREELNKLVSSHASEVSSLQESLTKERTALAEMTAKWEVVGGENGLAAALQTQVNQLQRDLAESRHTCDQLFNELRVARARLSRDGDDTCGAPHPSRDHAPASTSPTHSPSRRPGSPHGPYEFLLPCSPTRRPGSPFTITPRGSPTRSRSPGLATSQHQYQQQQGYVTRHSPRGHQGHSLGSYSHSGSYSPNGGEGQKPPWVGPFDRSPPSSPTKVAGGGGRRSAPASPVVHRTVTVRPVAGGGGREAGGGGPGSPLRGTPDPRPRSAVPRPSAARGQGGVGVDAMSPRRVANARVGMGVRVAASPAKQTQRSPSRALYTRLKDAIPVQDQQQQPAQGGQHAASTAEPVERKAPGATRQACGAGVGATMGGAGAPQGADKAPLDVLLSAAFGASGDGISRGQQGRVLSGTGTGAGAGVPAQQQVADPLAALIREALCVITPADRASKKVQERADRDAGKPAARDQGAVCVRCNQPMPSGPDGDSSSQWCRFHPALLADPGVLRYTPEYFACRAAGHTQDEPGCHVRPAHWYPPSAATGLDADSRAASKEGRLSTPQSPLRAAARKAALASTTVRRAAEGVGTAGKLRAASPAARQQGQGRGPGADARERGAALQKQQEAPPSPRHVLPTATQRSASTLR